MSQDEPKTQQLDLFGGSPPATALSRKQSSASVAASTHDANLIALGKALPASVFLGTSSWSFPGWQGLVYAGAHTDAKLARDGLAAYARHPLLKSVGIDRTFYAPIARADYARYKNQVPESFRFLVKAPMAVTASYVRTEAGGFSDSPFYFDPHYTQDTFIEPCLAGLGDTAGPLVFQFPPQGAAATREPDRWINRLYRFLQALPPGPLYGVEIRDAALLTPRFFTCLKTVGVTFCVASHAKMPSPEAQIVQMHEALGAGAFARAFIARWSLHAGFKYEDAKSRYAPFNQLVDEDLDSRAALAGACLAAVEAACPAFVIINNKAEGSAPLSIEKLAERITRQHG